PPFPARLHFREEVTERGFTGRPPDRFQGDAAVGRGVDVAALRVGGPGEQPDRNDERRLRGLVAHEVHAEFAANPGGELLEPVAILRDQYSRHCTPLGPLEGGEGLVGAVSELSVDEVGVVAEQRQAGLRFGALLGGERFKPGLALAVVRERRSGPNECQAEQERPWQPAHFEPSTTEYRAYCQNRPMRTILR